MNLFSTFTHLFHPQRSNNHRPRVLHPRAFFFFSLIALGFVGLLNRLPVIQPRMGNVLGFASSITPSQIVDLTNKERAKVGLPDLTLNSKLTQAALAKGQDMFTNDYWAHISPDGKEPWGFITEAGYAYRVAGENLARDFSNTQDMVNAWMNSPTHKANIVNTKYQEIGIAVIDGEMSGHETTLVVQMFGTPQLASADPQIPDSDTQVIKVEDTAGSVVSGIEADQLDFSPATVLSGALIARGELKVPPLFSPLQLIKAFFLGLIMMIVLTLLYDGFVIGNRDTARIVGKNLAHLIFLVGVSFLIIFFKGGIVG